MNQDGVVWAVKGGARIECYVGQKRHASGFLRFMDFTFDLLSNLSIVTIVDSFLTLHSFVVFEENNLQIGELESCTNIV